MSRSTTIIHCCHHKVMTVYFKMVFEQMAEYLDCPFVLNPKKFEDCKGGLALSEHSQLEVLDWPVRGTHIIRDPLDIMVSGYFYHQHTQEPWCTEPREDGKSLQQSLKELPKAEGLRLEFEAVTVPTLWEMKDWNYQHRNFLELRYEDLIDDKDHSWKQRIASHYGFRWRDKRKFVDLMVHYSFENASGRELGTSEAGTHLRQGSPGDWRNHAPEELVWDLHLKYGSLFWKLGYGAR